MEGMLCCVQTGEISCAECMVVNQMGLKSQRCRCLCRLKNLAGSSARRVASFGLAIACPPLSTFAMAAFDVYGIRDTAAEVPPMPSWPIARPQLASYVSRIARPELRAAWAHHFCSLQTRRGLAVLPPCTWCGHPTGGFCDDCPTAWKAAVCSACGGTDASAMAQCRECAGTSRAAHLRRLVPGTRDPIRIPL